MHPKAISRENHAGQVPFPRSLSPLGVPSEGASVSTGSRHGASRGCPTNIAGDGADVAPHEGIFIRCFIFLKRAGVKLMMPPYTVDGGLNHITRKHDYITLVGLNFAHGFAASCGTDTPV